jgi:hypothetical protein
MWRPAIGKVMQTQMKPWYASTTLWFNAIAFISGLGVYLLDQDLIKQYPETVTIIGGVVTVANFILRFKTMTAIETAARKEKE